MADERHNKWKRGESTEWGAKRRGQILLLSTQTLINKTRALRPFQFKTGPQLVEILQNRTKSNE